VNKPGRALMAYKKTGQHPEEGGRSYKDPEFLSKCHLMLRPAHPAMQAITSMRATAGAVAD
jgi:hypothetical protein